MEQKHALGRRKSAVARVYVVAGTGNIVINGRPVNEYFKEDALLYIVNQPFEVTGTTGQFDVKVTLVGGGTKGQAEYLPRPLRGRQGGLPRFPEGRRFPHPRCP